MQSNKWTLNNTDVLAWLEVLKVSLVSALVLYLTDVLSNFSHLTGLVTWVAFRGAFAFTPTIAVAMTTILFTNAIYLLNRFRKGQST